MISTQTLAEAASLMETYILTDTLNICSVGDTVTIGYETSRELTTLEYDVRSLVQTTTLQNAVESAVVSTYSVKVPVGTVLEAGMVVEVVSCTLEPTLVGKRLLIDKVSQNGAAMLRKCVASDFENVDQQGKAVL